MAKINTYLNFNGNTEEAFQFYRSVFGGDFLAVQKFRDTPGCEEMQINDLDKIMHIALPIGENILMGTDIMPPIPPATFGTAVSLSVDAATEEEARKFFDDLSTEGKIIMPLAKMFWGGLYGMLIDRYGIQWMINYDYSRK